MRAVVYQAPGKVALADVPEPHLQADTDAVVRVSLAAICGTDLHMLRGHVPGIEPGTVLGHEFVGVVVEVGSAVRRVRVGDTVMSSDFTACGTCWWCRRGEHWHCPERQFFGTGAAFGKPLPGAQAEYVRVPFADTTLEPLPFGVCPTAALLIGDNLATGWVSVQRGGVRPGDVVAIVGGGPVGQLASLSAQTVGAGVVVVCDPVDSRRDLAARHGAVSVTPEELTVVVGELTEGRGSDVVVEAVGSPSGLELALTAVRRRGTVVSAGAHTEPTWPLPLARAFAQEVTLTFAIGDSIRTRSQLASLVAAHVLDPSIVVTGKLALTEAVVGYRDLQEFGAMKVLLDPEEDGDRGSATLWCTAAQTGA
ncbi:hypothetical protein C3Y87_17235 [Carbonactinospora thermoautotrophica]|uniref:alcohol dehydrogenase catalytic domain-containing protein n=1 Tax=Carbonactinospora thermoautotrophica TaxID=1469144 RepID=UPI00226F497F|nr:alcohol dehydrogenase catalytic domain-containing protein [Carbonactinospora thermoautotrophica]MCX9193125.1 hypothetical protein [Carbonactinospora thermoautotrophica]